MSGSLGGLWFCWYFVFFGVNSLRLCERFGGASNVIKRHLVVVGAQEKKK